MGVIDRFFYLLRKNAIVDLTKNQDSDDMRKKRDWCLLIKKQGNLKNANTLQKHNNFFAMINILRQGIMNIYKTLF